MDPFLLQLDLFNDRHVLLVRAREALAAARIDDARHELLLLARRYPHDEAIRAELARAQELLARLTEVELLEPKDRPCALFCLAQRLGAEPGGTLVAALRSRLLRRVGEELERSGDATLLDGHPPGFYFFLAGALGEAAASLARAVAVERRPRWLALLGDVHFTQGRAAQARRFYGEALIADPFDVDWDQVKDEDVRSLPELARSEFAIIDDAVAWAAPVGVVLGILPALEPASCGPVSERMASPLAFLRAYRRATSSGADGRAVIEGRREMKRLAPALFDAYLDRVRSR